MRFLRKIPFIKLAIPYILGIFTSHWLYFQYLEFGFIFLTLLIFTLSFTWASKQKIYSFLGICGTLLLFIFGVIHTKHSTDKPQNDSYLIDDGLYYVLAVVDEIPSEKERSVKIPLKILEVMDTSNLVQKKEGKLMAYFEKTDEAIKLEPGEILAIKTNLEKLKINEHSIGFNFNQYLLNNGYSHTVYLKKEYWQKTSNIDPSVKYNLNKIRMQLMQLFKDKGLEETNLAIASALILGYRDLITPEIKNNFASAGATHILAVSGLHVGIIYLMLNYMLSFLKTKRQIIFKTIIILLFLWFYASLTGLSPSVIRASVMFSFVAVGAATKRYSNIYNTIAASAFAILVYNPQLIYSIGFQLSYLAVLGIIYIQPKIYERFKSPYWLIDKAWALLCVSIAAQLATFPLGLYYFNQFPNLFFITNLVVVPAAGWVIYSGMASLVFSFIPYLDIASIYILNFIVNFIRESVELVNSLPYSSTQNIYITSTQTVLLYIFVIGFGLMISNKIKASIFIFLLATNLWISESIFFDWKTSHNKYLVIYNDSTHNAELINGRTSWLLNTENLDFPNPLRENIKGEFKIKDYKKDKNYTSQNFDLFTQNIEFIWMKDNQFSIKESQNSIWILNNFNVAIPDSLFEIVKPQKVIINNVNYKTKNSLIRNSEGLDFEIYDLKKQGMYVHQL